MKVKEIMTANPKACMLTNNLAEAASMMWENDCGILPVLAEGKVVGLVRGYADRIRPKVKDLGPAGPGFPAASNHTFEIDYR